MLFGHTFLNDQNYAEYLSQGNSIEGIWIGNAASDFGVTPGSPVQEHEFESLRQNKHVLSGKRLTRRMNQTRLEWVVYKDELIQRRVANRRTIYDFTCSIPKSFSVAALVGGVKEIFEWHDQALDKMVTEMEKATSRFDKCHGQCENRTTGKFCGMRFTHLTNRSGEPDLHTHITLVNATPDGDKNYAVNSWSWFEKCQFLTAIYRDCLHSSARKAGFEIVIDEFGAPQLKQILDLNPLFSQRSADIKMMVDAAEELVGSTLTNVERKRLVMECRGIDLPRFHEIWRSERSKVELDIIRRTETKNARFRLLDGLTSVIRECSDEGSAVTVDEAKVAEWKDLLDPEQRLRLESVGGRCLVSPTSCYSTGSLQFAARYLFERRSVCKDHEILATALQHAQGSDVDLEQLRQDLHTLPGLIHRNGEVTTDSHFNRETQIFEWIEEGRCQGLKVGKRLDVTLNSSQLRAVNELLNSQDQFTALIGKAGVGKSRCADALIATNIESGYRVAALAPSTRARDVLDHGDRATLQRFLIDPALRRHLVPKDLIVLDEAGFASVEQVHALFELARSNQWRVCLIGDPKQNVSVEAGDALRILLNRTKIKREWLEKIIRQDPAAMEGKYLRAAKLFSQGKSTEGFAMLDRAGAIHVAHGQQRIDEMAKLFHEEQSLGRSVVCCNPSHRENDLINEAIRQRFKMKGFLRDEYLVNLHRSLGWTLAERQQLGRLRPGLILEITQGKDKGQSWEIRQVECDRAYAVRNGQRRRFDKGNAEVWQVCQRRIVPIAIGDWMITRSGMVTRGKEVTNGERFTVAGFEFQGSEISAIRTTDGKVIQTRNLDYAYAGTSHRSQGATADTVIFGIDRNSVRWADKKLAYVSATRGRTKVALFCESRADLCLLESRVGDRKSAVEMVKFCVKNALRRRPAIRQKQTIPIAA